MKPTRGTLHVIPGRAKRGPGIHNPDWCEFRFIRGYGFPARELRSRPGMTGG